MELFNKLNKEKQDIVINAGFVCFGKNGYNKASMADIAEVAGISKASLFQYFGSKRKFYLYLYELGCNKIINSVTKKMQPLSDDFFERMVVTQEIKTEMILQYPSMYDFFYASLDEQDPEVIDGIDKSNISYISDGYQLLLDGINWGKFKPGIDENMVMNMVTWFSEGYVKSIMGQDKTMEEMNKEIYKYLDLLKQSLYKEEYLQ